MELINKQKAIDDIMGEFPDAHYPNWFASIIEREQSVGKFDMSRYRIDINKAIKLLTNERTCVNTDACDHDCDTCALAGEQDEISDALSMGIEAIKIIQSIYT